MNENINLCEILKDREGSLLYSIVYGYVTLIKIDDFIHISVISINGIKFSVSLEKDGSIYGYNGECTIFPSKEQRDWSKFEKPIIPIDAFMMCSHLPNPCNFVIRHYGGINKSGHFSFIDNGTYNSHIGACTWKYMIPYDKFDPNNIKESLKYNIQK